MSKKPEIDEYTGLETTGHEWDGIKELTNPTPRWWLWVFLATIVWSIGYWVLLPAWPMLSDYTRGTENYSSREQALTDVANGLSAQAILREQLLAADFEDIRDNEALFDFAYQGGRSAFALNCAACHGSGAAGAPGIANLNDDDWIWGGTLEDIHTTISHGVRSEDLNTRYSEMPAFGDGFLSDDELNSLADTVLALSGGTPIGNNQGGQLFEAHCAACHGSDGMGIREMGAPRLADGIWLYGGTKEDILRQMRAPRHGMMPAWNNKLDAATLKQLTIYVHSLGGGE